jgi:hypothetical protein
LCSESAVMPRWRCWGTAWPVAGRLSVFTMAAAERVQPCSAVAACNTSSVWAMAAAHEVMAAAGS